MKKLFILSIILAFTLLNAKNHPPSTLSKDNSAIAQYNLGLHYKNSKSKNLRTAFKWMHKSALKGYVPAQYEFALMFHYGEGVKQNFDLAHLWFKRAADKGNSRARVILYRFYAEQKMKEKIKKRPYHYSRNFRTIRQ